MVVMMSIIIGYNLEDVFIIIIQIIFHNFFYTLLLVNPAVYLVPLILLIVLTVTAGLTCLTLSYKRFSKSIFKSVVMLLKVLLHIRDPEHSDIIKEL